MINTLGYLILILLPMTSSAVSSLKHSSPEMLIQNQFPGSKILVQTECAIGDAKIKSIGYLIQKDFVKGSNHPLEAIIVYQINQQWTLSEIPKRLDYSKGSASDFLYYSWSTKTAGLVSKYEILCVTPNEDTSISESANGDFSENFRKGKNGKHICFQADSVYNSWACFNFNPKTKKIETSFSQMNAD